jgi:hypothetical protein
LKKDEMLYETPVNEGSDPSGPTPAYSQSQNKFNILFKREPVYKAASLESYPSVSFKKQQKLN